MAATGMKPTIRKPTAVTAGTNVRVKATPACFITRPVKKNCAPKVRRLTIRSMRAKKAVRAVRSAKLRPTIAAC
jgi:hypothetical protein